MTDLNDDEMVRLTSERDALVKAGVEPDDPRIAALDDRITDKIAQWADED